MTTRGRRGFWSWAIGHVRPGMSFDHPGYDEAYWASHGGKPDDLADVGQWLDYVKDNATFSISLKFDF